MVTNENIKTDFNHFNENFHLPLTDARGHRSLVVIGVDAYIVILKVKGKLAEFDMLQFILMQVWPPPQPGVDHMREAFTSSHLGTERTRWDNTGQQSQWFSKLTV